jgi:hypothetical protein
MIYVLYKVLFLQVHGNGFKKNQKSGEENPLGITRSHVKSVIITKSFIFLRLENRFTVSYNLHRNFETKMP